MDGEIWKWIIAAAGTIIAAFVVRNGNQKVSKDIAISVNSIRDGAQQDLERLKKDFQKEVQLEIERQKNEYQSAMERQRQDFQRALDADKFHMEIYKPLYLEKSAAAAGIMSSAGEIYAKLYEGMQRIVLGTVDESFRQECRTTINVVMVKGTQYKWIAGDEICTACVEYQAAALKTYLAILNNNFEAVGKTLKELNDALEDLTAKVTEMMHTYEPGRLLKVNLPIASDTDSLS